MGMRGCRHKLSAPGGPPDVGRVRSERNTRGGSGSGKGSPAFTGQGILLSCGMRRRAHVPRRSQDHLRLNGVDKRRGGWRRTRVHAVQVHCRPHNHSAWHTTSTAQRPPRASAAGTAAEAPPLRSAALCTKKLHLCSSRGGWPCVVAVVCLQRPRGAHTLPSPLPSPPRALAVCLEYSGLHKSMTEGRQAGRS